MRATRILGVVCLQNLQYYAMNVFALIILNELAFF